STVTAFVLTLKVGTGRFAAGAFGAGAAAGDAVGEVSTAGEGVTGALSELAVDVESAGLSPVVLGTVPTAAAVSSGALLSGAGAALGGETESSSAASAYKSGASVLRTSENLARSCSDGGGRSNNSTPTPRSTAKWRPSGESEKFCPLSTAGVTVTDATGSPLAVSTT